MQEINVKEKKKIKILQPKQIKEKRGTHEAVAEMEARVGFKEGSGGAEQG